MDTESGFKSALNTYGKFLKVLGNQVKEEPCQKMIEKIVFWMTVYGDDRKYVKERIQEEFGGRLSDGQLKRILGYKFSDWGKLSKEFLDMQGDNAEDNRSILTALWETNDNLMELLSARYSYKKALEKRTQKAIKELSEWTPDDLHDLYLSAPVRRMVWQSLRIMNELVEVTGHKPDRIYVEMPREEGEKGKRTVSRKKKLSDLYAALKSEGKAWKNEIDSKDESAFRRKKLYLYYLQMGRCIYTGEAIDLELLLKDNTIYDIDHIYPRHYVKDDSVENNLVLVKKEKNSHKSDTFPVEKDIRMKQGAFWKTLLDKGFMSREKYSRLTRVTEFTEEEKAAFISRQLVETRQGTKAITEILQAAFPETTVVFSKAGEVSDFRAKYDLPKVRCLNDMHHAKDAYLNIVVGNTYYVKFTSDPVRFIKEASKNPGNKLYQYNMDKIFEYDVIRGNEVAWIGTGKEKKTDTAAEKEYSRASKSLKTVKSTLAKNSVLITKRPYIAHGGITGKDTVYSAKLAGNNSNAYIASSSDPRLSDVSKYGGRTDITTMCYSLVEYFLGNNKVISLEALPVYLGDIYQIADEKVYSYLLSSISLENNRKQVSGLKILKKVVPFNSYVKVEGHYYYLGGRTGSSICIKNGRSLLLNKEHEYYLKKIEKALATGNYSESDKRGNTIITREKNVDFYDMIIEKLESAYVNKKTSILEVLKANEDVFKQQTIDNQIQVLLNIIQWMNLECVAVDLSIIGSGKKMGYCRMNKRITDCKEAVLINQSVTGLYETRMDMLKL